MTHLRERATHSDHLERWLGREHVEQLSLNMRDWYGPPIAINGVPGKVMAFKGGDFRGEIRAGYEASARDRIDELARRVKRGFRVAVRNAALGAQVNAGFTSLGDLIAEASAGKRREYQYQKAGATGVSPGASSLWGLGNAPPAGANASNAPGGDALTDATTGAFPFANPTGGDTQHFVAGWVCATVQSNNLLLYDRLFQVNKTMNSTATEAVTGVPTRYQSTTGGEADSAEGNFLFPEIGGTALAATAHNWTVCLYTDQGGTGTITLPSVTGLSGGIVRRLDMVAPAWFAPLATGDTGIQQLDQMQCSALVATGVINFVIGHPIAWMPCPIANLVCAIDGINTSFNLARIFDDAALALMEVSKPNATATTYTGTFTTVSG